MGMWQGILQGYESAKDRKRQEEAEAKLDALNSENMRLKKLDLVFNYLKTRNSSSSTQAREMAVEMRKLQSMGLPDDVNSFLIRSGESKEILETYKGLGSKKPSRIYMISLVEKIRKVLGNESTPQALAMAASSSLKSGEDLSTPEGKDAAFQEAYFEAIYDSNIDPLSLLELKQEPSPIRIQPIGGLSRGMQNVGTQELTRINNIVKKRLATEFDVKFTVDDYGVTFTDYAKSSAGPKFINQIVADTVTQVQNNVQGVNALSVNTAINNAVDHIINLKNVYNVPTEKMPEYTFNFSLPPEPFKPEEKLNITDDPTGGVNYMLNKSGSIFDDSDFK